METSNDLKNIKEFAIRYKGAFMSLLVMVVVILLIVGFLTPNINSIQESMANMNAQGEKIIDLKKKATFLSQTNKAKEAENLKKITTVLPEEKDVFTIFTGIDGLQNESGVLVTESDFKVGVISTESAVQAAGASKKKKDMAVDIKFEAVGSKEAVIKLLNLLGSVKSRLFTARDVNIEFIGGDQVRVGFILSAYYSSFPVSLGSIDSNLAQLSPPLVSLKDLIQKEAVITSETVHSITSGKSDLFSPR